MAKFTRSISRYPVNISALTTVPRPEDIPTIGSIDVAAGEQLDAVGFKLYQNSLGYRQLYFKNIHRMLSWNLNGERIIQLDVPRDGSYT